MFCTIYAIKNNQNSKIYIGQTWKSLNVRWNSGSGYNSCILLSRAIEKYGKDSFYYEILGCASNQELADYLEQYYIEYYKTNVPEFGYNIKNGGSRGSHSKDTKQKISKSLTGREISEITKQKLAISNIGNTSHLGKKHSDATKKKISVAKSGKNNHNFGKQFSEEHRKKISEALTGKIVSETAKNNMSKGQLGNKNATGKNKGKTWKVIDGKRVWIEREIKNDE